MALSEYDKQYLTAQQQAQIQSLTNQWNDLDAQYRQAKESGDTALAEQLNKQKADVHTQAEGIRAAQGYLGGSAGSEYNAVEQQQTAPKYTAPSVTDYSSYLEDMYAAKKSAALAEIEAAYEKNRASIDRAGAGLEESYRNARNQTVGASELAKRNNAQYAAANGLNSGTGGQAELARNVALQNNLNTVNTQQAQSVADLHLQRANAETEYNNAIAQAQADGNYELANALYQEKVRVQEALMNLQIQQYQLEYQSYRDKVGDSQWQQSFDQSKAQQEYENLFNQAQFDYAQAQDAIANSQWQQSFDHSAAQQQYENSLASQKYQDSQTAAQKEILASYGAAYLEAGIMPSAEMLTAMGISEADAKLYITAVKNADGANLTTVGEALTDMVRAGANMTELRSALRGALNEGILTQAEYEQLCGIYLPGWRT